jgi:hypothetical protein
MHLSEHKTCGTSVKPRFGEAGAPADEIEITPEMIEAGLKVLRSENLDLSLSAAEDLVREIILRTWKAR